MELGADQLNTFDTFSLDSWKDRVYYEGHEFPAGYFSAEILNFAGELDEHEPLLDRISILTELVCQAAYDEEGRGNKALEELLPLMKDAISWIYTCPPFCYQDEQDEWRDYTFSMDLNRIELDVTNHRNMGRFIF